ncbi:MAG: Fur family transcriptional regulator [Geminicoccaceae bacterium]
MSSAAPLAFARHDHGECRKSAIAEAKKLCDARSVRLTPVRERVLELLWEAHQPVRAYDILERLGSEGFGSQPPVVYRALDFLIEHGFAHKIECLNAYLACDCPGADHGAKFLICTGCNRVAEFDDQAIARALKKIAGGSGFEIGRATLEVEGLCPDCAGPDCSTSS